MNKTKIVLIPSILVACMVILTLQVYAMSSLEENSNILENGKLHGQTKDMSISIQFGEDEIQELAHRKIVHPQIEEINLSINDRKITLNELEMHVAANGRVFRISSLPDGIMIFAHQIDETLVYDISVFYNTTEKMNEYNVNAPLEYNK